LEFLLPQGRSISNRSQWSHRTGRLSEPDLTRIVSETRWALRFFFREKASTAFAGLEDIVELIRLENKVQQLAKKLGPKHPVGVRAFHLLTFFEFLRSWTKTEGAKQSPSP